MRRLNDFLASHRFVQAISTLVLIGFFLLIYRRMTIRNLELEEYWLALTCPSPTNCREKIEGKIIDSYGLTVFIKGFATKHISLPSSGSTHYGILLSSPLGMKEIEIMADPPSNGTPFDIQNVRIPSGSDSLFVSKNLSVDQIVYFEVWKDKITILYLDEYLDTPDPILQPTPNPEIKPAFVDNPSPKTYEIALPTTFHPILLQAGAERDFFATSIVCVILFWVLYGGDVDQLSKRIWKKKKVMERV